MSKLNHSQQEILRRLKLRGPQSVKILASQLEITAMGTRQHLLAGARRCAYKISSWKTLDRTEQARN